MDDMTKKGISDSVKSDIPSVDDFDVVDDDIIAQQDVSVKTLKENNEEYFKRVYNPDTYDSSSDAYTQFCADAMIHAESDNRSTFYMDLGYICNHPFSNTNGMDGGKSGKQKSIVKNGNDDSDGKRFKKDKCKVLNIADRVRSLALKFYVEQIDGSVIDFINTIISFDPKVVQVMAICHFRDIIDKGIWECARAKPHWHVILRFVDHNCRKRIVNILNALKVKYRPGLDDELWKEHGVETVGDFASYAVYLLHETKQARRDGKERYAPCEIISNLTMEEQEQIRAGYVRLSDNRKITEEELVSLDKEAYDLGFSLKNFDKWYDALPFKVRCNTKMRVICESYERGARAKMELHELIPRLNLFIMGLHNGGKTFATQSVYAEKGLEFLTVRGGGSGKFDNLKPYHNAIVIDDDICPNLLNMSDSYICRAYRRNRNNPIWAGNYFVVTSNLTFAEWLAMCGIEPFLPHSTSHWSKHGMAMRSRFLVCSIVCDDDGHKKLYLSKDGCMLRGNNEQQKQLMSMYVDFRDRFNRIIDSYHPEELDMDYSSIIDGNKHSALWMY